MTLAFGGKSRLRRRALVAAAILAVTFATLLGVLAQRQMVAAQGGGGGETGILLLEGACTGSNTTTPTWVFHFYAPQTDQGTGGTLTVDYRVGTTDLTATALEAADNNTNADWFVPLSLSDTIQIVSATTDTLAWTGEGESGNTVAPDACRKVRIEKLTEPATHPAAAFSGTIAPVEGTSHGNPPTGTGGDSGETATFTVSVLANAASGSSFQWVTTAAQTVAEAALTGWTLDGFAIQSDPNGTATCTGVAFATANTSIPASSTPQLLCIQNTYTGGDTGGDDGEDGDGGQPAIILLEGACTGTDPVVPTWIFHFFAPHTDSGAGGLLTVHYTVNGGAEQALTTPESADNNTKADWRIPLALTGPIEILDATTTTLAWTGAGEFGNPVTPDACRVLRVGKVAAPETHPAGTFTGTAAVVEGEDHGNKPPDVGDDAGETPTFSVTVAENAAYGESWQWITQSSQTVVEAAPTGWELDGYVVPQDSAGACPASGFGLATNIVPAGTGAQLVCIKNTYTGAPGDDDDEDGGRPAIVTGHGTCLPTAASPTWVFHAFAPPPAESGVGPLSVTYSVGGGTPVTVSVPEAVDHNPYPDWYWNVPLTGQVVVTAASATGLEPWNAAAGAENAIVDVDACRQLSFQKTTGSASHPAATFTGAAVAPEEEDEGGPGKPDDPGNQPPGVGDEEVEDSFSLNLLADAPASEIDTIWATTAQQTVTETPPAPGWTLIGYALVPNDAGTATCEGAVYGAATNVVPPATGRYLVCIRNDFASALGSITIATDDARTPMETPGTHPISGATFRLELIVNDLTVETVCVTDDKTADTSPAIPVACAGVNPHLADDENDTTEGLLVVSNLPLGTWRITEIGLPENREADTCTNEWHATRELVLTSDDPTAAANGNGCGPTSSFHNPRAEGEEQGGGGKQVTITAYAAICDSFDLVPRNPGSGATDDWADHSAGAVDATSPVQAASPLPAGCHLATGSEGETFSFNYRLAGEMITHPNPQPAGGIDFGSPTGSGGFTSTALARHNFTGPSNTWVSEVPAANFAFAGLRCYDDIANQDNSESIHLVGGKGQPHPPEGTPNHQTVYCVAYNVPLGTLQIVKHDNVDAAHGGAAGTWDFTISGPSGFEAQSVSVARNTGATSTVLATMTVPAGVYSVAETNGNGQACTAQATKTFQTGFGAPGNVQSNGSADVSGGTATIVDVYNTDCGVTLGAGNLRVTVISDTNGNKLRDAGEAEASGVGVTLTCAGQADMHSQTALRLDGHITADFSSLPNNVTCTVSQTAPQGYAVIGWRSTDTGGPANADGTGSTTSIHMDDNDANTVTFFNQPPPPPILPVVIPGTEVVSPEQPDTPTPTATPTTTTTTTATPQPTGTATPTSDTDIVLGEKTVAPGTPAAPSTGSGQAAVAGHSNWPIALGAMVTIILSGGFLLLHARKERTS